MRSKSQSLNFGLRYKKKKNNKNQWFLDSDCSKHMINDFIKFSNFTWKESEFVTFVDTTKGKIMGINDDDDDDDDIVSLEKDLNDL